MKKIDVNEEIIVFVIYNKIKNWYICDKEIWFLDEKKRTALYCNLGYDIKEEYIDEKRKNLLVLDTNNANIFLDRIKDDMIQSSELRKICLEAQNKEKETWKYNYMPSLYVDFDRKELFSIYSEPASYEDYVPPGWKSDFKSFVDLIPKEYCYWK